MGFPQEFAIYLPLFSEGERNQLDILKEDHQVNDSLKNFKEFLLEFVESQEEPSTYLLYSLGKILYYISEFNLIDELHIRFPSIGLVLWKISVLLEKGYNEEAIKTASQLKENKETTMIFKLHALRTIAKGYLNLGNYEQCRIYLNMLSEEALIVQKLPPEEKPVVDDILLDGHRDNFLMNRYVEEKIKLENKLNVALHIATELKDRNHVGIFYYLLALLQKDSGKLDESLSLTFQAIEIFGETSNDIMLAAANGNIGTINVILGKLEDAEIIFNEIKTVFQKTESNRYLALTIKSLG
ncbi:MAG: hypothetical protein KAJ30_05965, partial [Candidatus Heimdallarchaeota archaeon]|nr:hypothetical protein [Candidatus Heimdallarchaeota archaeon]